MTEAFPAEVAVTEGAGGICYRFPARPLGAHRYRGVALLLPGLVLCSLPLVAVCLVILAVLQHVPFIIGAVGFVVLVSSRSLIRGGIQLAKVGLFILSGHSEIELGRDTLTARECCGPLRWAWQRSTADLRHFLVSASLGPVNSIQGARKALAVLLNLLFGSCRGVAVLTPQWKPAVADQTPAPLWLAPGYPRSWLLAVADDLARRCLPPAEPAAPSASPPLAQAVFAPTADLTTAPALPAQPLVRPLAPVAPAAARVGVVEGDADLAEYEELAEQPTGSKIAVDRSADRLTFIVPPPGWQANRGWLVGAILSGLLALLMTGSLFDRGITWGSLAALVLLALVGWALAVVFFLVAYTRSCRRVVLDVTGERLVVWQSGLFLARPREWSRQQLADIFVVQRFTQGEDPTEYWELQIYPQAGEGRALHLLDNRDLAELRWLATVLRRTLLCPGTSPHSPPPGFVVQSTGLDACWHKRRPTS
jgi:hypothetical protein